MAMAKEYHAKLPAYKLADETRHSVAMAREYPIERRHFRSE